MHFGPKLQRKLVDVLTWFWRATVVLTADISQMSQILQSTKLSDAQTFLLQKAQLENFPSGEKDKRLLRFSPLLDKDGLLRLDGRLRLDDDLSCDTRNPVILPRNHYVTRLDLMDAHESLVSAQERSIC